MNSTMASFSTAQQSRLFTAWTIDYFILC
jgi:hypothetical protein